MKFALNFTPRCKRFTQVYRTMATFTMRRDPSVWDPGTKATLLTPFSPPLHPEVRIPKFIYGTAWKEERTAGLVYDAIKSGFRGIDTAAQPAHYQEDAVCEGIKKAIDEGIVTRKELHIQTKFTPPSGQNPVRGMPYDPSAPLATQITDSINSSLKNLTFSSDEEPYIDTLLLHSPLPTLHENRQAFAHLASYVPTKIRSLGISNVDLETLKYIHETSPVPPCVVQNRFIQPTKYDMYIRKFCQRNDILYQAFWTLTGNPIMLRSSFISRVANRLGTDHPLALYCLMILGQRGISVLNGTSDLKHMTGDLEGLKRVAGMICEDSEFEQEWWGFRKQFHGSLRDRVRIRAPESEGMIGE